MKKYITKTLSVFLFITPLIAWCQTPSTDFDYNRGVPSSYNYGPRIGESDFTIGGSGTANKRMNDSLGGVNFAYGYYLTNLNALVVRQTVNYSNPRGQNHAWSGATRLAFDQYLSVNSRWRPFLGGNFGGVYGNALTDTWVAGLETGVKFYVRPRVFIEVMAEYDWYFRHSRDIDNRFNSGQWNWSVGTGFTF